jgi:hypothetical protein
VAAAATAAARAAAVHPTAGCRWPSPRRRQGAAPPGPDGGDRRGGPPGADRAPVAAHGGAASRPNPRAWPVSGWCPRATGSARRSPAGSPAAPDQRTWSSPGPGGNGIPRGVRAPLSTNNLRRGLQGRGRGGRDPPGPPGPARPSRPAACREGGLGFWLMRPAATGSGRRSGVARACRRRVGRNAPGHRRLPRGWGARPAQPGRPAPCRFDRIRSRRRLRRARPRRASRPRAARQLLPRGRTATRSQASAATGFPRRREAEDGPAGTARRPALDPPERVDVIPDREPADLRAAGARPPSWAPTS